MKFLSIIALAVPTAFAVEHGPQQPPSSSEYPDYFDAVQRLNQDQVQTVNGLTFATHGREVLVTGWNEANRERTTMIESYRMDEGRWQSAGSVFPATEYHDYQPVLSPDGSILLFTSTRPTTGNTPEPARQNVWYATRDSEAAAWKTPQPVAHLTSEGWDGHAVLTRNGDLYFASERAGGLGMVDIFRTRLASNSPVTPVAEFNSPVTDNDFHITPDAKTIVLTRYDPQTNDLDLFIAFRQRHTWTTPAPIESANTSDWELSPTITPDERWLVFVRHQRFHTLEMAGVRADAKSRLD